jgi:hypothetical protein
LISEEQNRSSLEEHQRKICRQESHPFSGEILHVPNIKLIYQKMVHIIKFHES